MYYLCYRGSRLGTFHKLGTQKLRLHFLAFFLPCKVLFKKTVTHLLLYTEANV